MKNRLQQRLLKVEQIVLNTEAGIMSERTKLRTPVLVAALCVVVALIGAAQETTPGGHAPVVAHLIETTVVETSKGEIVHFSPDGKQFVIVTRRGNLATNTNDYTLLLFRSDEVFRFPVAERLLTFASGSNMPAIGEVRWTDDSHILFCRSAGEWTITSLLSGRRHP